MDQDELLISCIKDLSHSVRTSAQAIDRMATQLDGFLRYQSELSERFRKDLVRIVCVLFILVFSVLFGLPETAKIISSIRI